MLLDDELLRQPLPISASTTLGCQGWRSFHSALHCGESVPRQSAPQAHRLASSSEEGGCNSKPRGFEKGCAPMLPAREQTPALLQLCCSMRLSSSRLPLQATNALAQPLSLPPRSGNCKRREEKARLPEKQQRPRWRNLPFFALNKYFTYRNNYGKVIIYTSRKLFEQLNWALQTRVRKYNDPLPHRLPAEFSDSMASMSPDPRSSSCSHPHLSLAWLVCIDQIRATRCRAELTQGRPSTGCCECCSVLPPPFSSLTRPSLNAVKATGASLGFESLWRACE
ncbi:hypothetical protein ISCGN_026779 [Ixodes scapularis]